MGTPHRYRLLIGRERSGYTASLSVVDREIAQWVHRIAIGCKLTDSSRNFGDTPSTPIGCVLCPCTNKSYRNITISNYNYEYYASGLLQTC